MTYRHKKIAFGGDSTVTGRVWRPGNPPDVLEISPWNECATFTKLAKEKFGDENVTTVNWGMGGTNTHQWAYGDPAIGMPTMGARMLDPANADVDIYVHQTQINDAYNGAVALDGFAWDIQVICKAVRAAGKTIVLQTACPIDVPGQVTERMWQMQKRILAVAAAMSPPVQVIDHFGATVAAIAGWPIILSDGTHPTDEGYRWKGHSTFLALWPHFL